MPINIYGQKYKAIHYYILRFILNICCIAEFEGNNTKITNYLSVVPVNNKSMPRSF